MSECMIVSILVWFLVPMTMDRIKEQTKQPSTFFFRRVLTSKSPKFSCQAESARCDLRRLNSTLF